MEAVEIQNSQLGKNVDLWLQQNALDSTRISQEPQEHGRHILNSLQLKAMDRGIVE